MRKLYSLLNNKLRYFGFYLAILILIATGLEILSLALVIPAVSFFFDNSIAEKFPIIFSFLVKVSPLNFFSYNSNFDIFEKAVVGGLTCLFLIFFIKTVYLIYFHYMQYRFVNNLRVYLSSKLLSGYLKQPYKFHLSHNSSELMRSVLTEVSNIVGTTFVTIQMISEIFVLLSFSIFLTYSYFVPSITVLSILLFLSTLFYIYSKNKIKDLGVDRHTSEEKRIRFVQEGLTGIKIIKVLGLENFFLRKFMESEKLQSMITLKYNMFVSLPRLLFELIIAISLITFLTTFIFQGYQQQEIITGISVFLVAAFRLMPSINKLLIGFQSLKFNNETIKKIHQEIADININESNFKITEAKNGKISFKKEILLKDVSLNYEDRDTILKNINLEIKKNEFIAITGPTGSGKSTLIDLIIGLIKPTSGKILIDNNNLNSNLDSWQRQIGYVPQTLHFLDDTLKNNIAYGIDEKSINNDQIQYCLESAQLKQFVNGLKNGLDSKIGEDALRISGGERKRIGIARALYFNPSVLILDEPTNELDSVTEKKIIELLVKLKSKITIILISHKDSSFKLCDKIYKIENRNIDMIKKN